MTRLCFGEFPEGNLSLEQLVDVRVRSALCLWVEEENGYDKQEAQSSEKESDLEVPASTLIR
jgi:hypothetical protein